MGTAFDVGWSSCTGHREVRVVKCSFGVNRCTRNASENVVHVFEVEHLLECNTRTCSAWRYNAILFSSD